jgi:A/G-specific adenine glycosylase
MSAPLIPADLALRVVHWQRLHGRHDLPWQRNRDPYRVWLSEIMLQQTQVQTARAYFERFVLQLPDVRSLARASLDQVLGLWSGLGYYSRARNLHACAQKVVAHWGGQFPATAAQLQTLPGIGPSTAAAIAATCFAQRVTIMDGNVKRVLSRVLGFDADLSRSRHVQHLWRLAQALIEPVPADQLCAVMPAYTQGLMDLGATVCTPKTPQCARCPLQPLCKACQMGNPTRFPVKTRRVAGSSESIWLLLAFNPRQQVWLQPRPTPGVWAGLYCPAWFADLESLLQLLPPAQQAQAEVLPVVAHKLTHKNLQLHPVRCVLPEHLTMINDQGGWYGPAQWSAMGLPAPVRVMLGLLKAD